MKLIVGTKLQFKRAIISFWTKFAKKGYFQSKTDKMNCPFEFCITKLV